MRLQVEFLCERGADVNRGLRSSSLHYAACFGRPQIVKVGSKLGLRKITNIAISYSVDSSSFKVNVQNLKISNEIYKKIE